MNEPSGGINETVPGLFAQRDSRTQGWKEGVEMAPGGDKARVTSGVSDSRDVQHITPDKVVDICFVLLMFRNSELRDYDDRVISRFSVISTKNSSALCRTAVLRHGIDDSVPDGTYDLRQ